MTSMKTIKCDRCNKVFTIPEEEDVAYLKHYDFKEVQTEDLCDNCSATIAMARSFEFHKQIDALVSELVK